MNYNLDPKYRWYSIELLDEKREKCKYVFRGVTARELRIAGTKETTFEAERFILNATVHPQKDWDSMLAGVVSRLLSEIYNRSGLTDEGTTFVEAINWIQSENGAMEAAAVAMIPSCTPELLENCDPYTYAKYLVMGKFQFESMYGIPVEQAFLPQKDRPTANNGIDITPNPGPPAMPGPGEVARQVENSFVWKRQN